MAKLNKEQSRARRKKGLRKKIFGTTERPRLSVFRSNRHIYAQIIDDTTGRTLASASTMAMEGVEDKKRDAAKQVGTLIAERCKDVKVEKVVFDRNGFVYTGRIAALADGAREAGLKF